MDIVELFNGVSDRMRSDLALARSVLEHPGLKGSSFEEAFRRFLREYLPARLDVSTGAIVDSTGQSSRQIDAIISDAAKTPIFYRSGDERVVPVEGVYAVIEVKAKLTVAELKRSFENMKSVRELRREAHLSFTPFSQTRTLYGRGWTDTWPLHFFVFAYDSTPLMTLMKKLSEMHARDDLPPWSRIDTVCVLNRGVIFNQLPNGLYGALPEPGSALGTINTKHALLLFYTLISHTLFQAEIPPFEFKKYLGQMAF